MSGIRSANGASASFYQPGRRPRTGPPIRDIQTAVALQCQVDRAAMLSSGVVATARHRQLAMYLAHRVTGRGLKIIAREFSRMDHTTVRHAILVTGGRLAVPSEMCGSHERACLALLDQSA